MLTYSREAVKIMFFQNYTPMKILGVYNVKRSALERRRGFTEGRDFASLALRVRGESHFESRGESFTAGEGSVIFIPSGVPFSRRGGDEELVILHLELFENVGEKIEVITPKNPDEVRRAFLSIYEIWDGGEAGFEHRAAAELHTILAKFIKRRSGALAPYQYATISRAVEMIETSFDDPSLTVASLAALSNVSAEYFRALYKSEFGISPKSAITERRIEKAKRLLEVGYFTVAEVAEDCGFKNVKHFSTEFSRRTGKSPRAWREKDEGRGTEDEGCDFL